MKSVTISNLPEEVYRAIQARATTNGRTLEAEICELLTDAVRSEGRVKLGDLLADIGRKVRLTDEEMAVFERNHSAARLDS